MPTVDFDHINLLPHVSAGNAEAVSRRVLKIVDAIPGFEGEGFPVNRAFAKLSTAETDPFIMMDELGAIEYEPGEPKGTPWHPHRGFETVTYMIDGIFNHQDSHGGGGVIKDGDTQWMTAGSGLLHIEKPPEDLVVSGGFFHGIQLWVNLASRLKWVTPRYQDIRANKLKLARSQDGGTLIRIIAGNIDDSLKGPGITYSPINLFHLSVYSSSRLVLNWPSNYNALAYVLSGTGFASDEMVKIFPGQTCLFGEGEVVTISAAKNQENRSPKLEVLLLGGEPIQEPIAWYGPFVMNTDNELKIAFDDYRKGKLGVIPAI